MIRSMSKECRALVVVVIVIVFYIEIDTLKVKGCGIKGNQPIICVRNVEYVLGWFGSVVDVVGYSSYCTSHVRAYHYFGQLAHGNLFSRQKRHKGSIITGMKTRTWTLQQPS